MPAILGGALIALALLVGSAVPASATPKSHGDVMTLTLVRHGESFGNTSPYIDTTTPGPHITPKGHEQAVAVAGKLAANGYDAVYASTMTRTQETAAPLATALGKRVGILPGIREIEAGDLEGAPNGRQDEYFAAMLKWIGGDLSDRIPGGMNGYQFDNRFDRAVRKMSKESCNAVAYSHGAAMMSWVLMNVQNPPSVEFAFKHLQNTVVIVVSGNPKAGWTLVSWDGVQFAPNKEPAAATG